MRYWIIIVMLVIVLLTGGSVLSAMRIARLSVQLDEVRSSLASLTSDYESLETDYNALESSHQVLQSKYDTLVSNYQSLESNYDSLQVNYNSLHSDYDTLQGKLSQLESSYSKLENDNRELQRILEQYEKVPQAYYSTAAFPHHPNKYDSLNYFLKFEFELPRGYETNVFDCSESAAYTEWALENAGFDAYIAIGRIPWDPSSGYHAWVMVHTSEYNVAIEATALTGEYKSSYLFTGKGRVPGVVYDNDQLIPGWNNYYDGYDNIFQNIYQAIRNHRTTEEWNWWEGYWGFK